MMIRLIAMPRYSARNPRRNAAGFAAVADLRELHVGHHAGRAPEPAKKNTVSMPLITMFHHSQLPATPLRGDEPRHDERRVGGECRGDHRRPGQPPRHLAPGEEVFLEALAASFREDEADDGRQREVADDDGPVDRGDVHRGVEGEGDGEETVDRSSTRTTTSASVVRTAPIRRFWRVGLTRFVNRMTNRSREGSTQIDVPVNPVCPKAGRVMEMAGRIRTVRRFPSEALGWKASSPGRW